MSCASKPAPAARLAAGEIGRPGVIRLTRGSYRPKKPAGNWFLDEAKSGGILMDLMMPGMDGIAASEAISAQLPRVQVVMMSVQGEADANPLV